MLRSMKDKMEICGSCGTIAPPGKYQCAQCHTPFKDNRVVVPPPEDELSYSRVCGSFTCRSCGHEIALSYFTLEGFQCPECHSHQRFDWGLWEDIVKYAHNVTDLCGFDPPDAADADFWQYLREKEGEDVLRRFRAIGRNSSAYVMTNSNPHLAQYKVELSPGNPVCVACGIPLKIGVAKGVLRTRCPDCGDKADYELMSNVDDYLFLFACIGTWHRAEQTEPQSRPTLRFPEEESTPWWMVFQGPSALRQKLERRVRRQKEETSRHNQRKEKRKAAALERHRRMKTKARKRAAAILVAIGLSTAAITSVVLHFLDFRGF